MLRNTAFARSKVIACTMIASTLVAMGPASYASEDTKTAEVPRQLLAPAIHVINQNIAGERNDGAGDWDGLATAVWGGATIVTAQEVCYADFVEFQATFGPHGWHSEFVSMLPASQQSNKCGPNDGNEADDPNTGAPGQIGQMIAANSPLTYVSRRNIGSGVASTPKKFTLLCGHVTWSVVDLCTTHLWAGQAGDTSEEARTVRKTQTQIIMNILNPHVDSGGRTILTGDFNSQPDTEVIDKIHRVTQAGGISDKRFWEADQVAPNGTLRRGGKATKSNGMKIDYIFFSHNMVGSRQVSMPDVTPWPTSDHHVMRGVALQ